MPLRSYIDTNLWGFFFNIFIFIFFSTQFNNNKIVQPMGLTQPMWVGLDLYDGLDWVEFFLTHHGGLGRVGLDLYDGLGWVGLNFFDPPWWVGSKNSLNLTQPNPYTILLSISCNPYEAVGLGNAICINYTLQLSNSWDL